MSDVLLAFITRARTKAEHAVEGLRRAERSICDGHHVSLEAVGTIQQDLVDALDLVARAKTETLQESSDGV